MTGSIKLQCIKYKHKKAKASFRSSTNPVKPINMINKSFYNTFHKTAMLDIIIVNKFTNIKLAKLSMDIRILLAGSFWAFPH